MQGRYTIAILVVLTLAAGIAISQPKVHIGQSTPQPRPPRGERLCPDWGVFDDPLVSPYFSFIAQKLLADLPNDRYAQMVVTSDVEHAIVIEAADECYAPNGRTRAIYSTARSSISNKVSALFQAMPQDQRTAANCRKLLATLSIPIDVTAAPIDCASAATLGRVWLAMVRRARYDDIPRSGPNCSGVMDGTTSQKVMLETRG